MQTFSHARIWSLCTLLAQADQLIAEALQAHGEHP